jgi:hypothetical protein
MASLEPWNAYNVIMQPEGINLEPPGHYELPNMPATPKLEAISKKGFWFKIAAGPSFKPQEYICISRI